MSRHWTLGEENESMVEIWEHGKFLFRISGTKDAKGIANAILRAVNNENTLHSKIKRLEHELSNANWTINPEPGH